MSFQSILLKKLQKKLTRQHASLQMKKNQTVIKDLFERIQIVKAPCGLYHLLRLEGLESGQYTLSLDFENRNIRIDVHKGSYWHDQFIYKKNCLMETSDQ